MADNADRHARQLSYRVVVHAEDLRFLPLALADCGRVSMQVVRQHEQHTKNVLGYRIRAVSPNVAYSDAAPPGAFLPRPLGIIFAFVLLSLSLFPSSRAPSPGNERPHATNSNDCHQACPDLVRDMVDFAP